MLVGPAYNRGDGPAGAWASASSRISAATGARKHDRTSRRIMMSGCSVRLRLHAEHESALATPFAVFSVLWLRRHSRIVLYIEEPPFMRFAIVRCYSWSAPPGGSPQQAQLSFYLQHPEHLRTGHGEIPMTGALRERIAVGAMYLLGERFMEAGPRWCVSDLADRLEVPATVLNDVMLMLEDHGLVMTAADDSVAGRDLASITLAQVPTIRH
jgi:hypothetical protein